MEKLKHINIISNRKQIVLNVDSILYVEVIGKISVIHTHKGNIYKTRITLTQLHDLLGENFIKIHRGCIVSAIAIHEITDKIQLLNGENLYYTKRKKNEIINKFHSAKKRVVNSFSNENTPHTKDEYALRYSSFDDLPFAFTDIEMLFDEEQHAVDWIFRYGNPALARLEKIPLEKLINNSFGNLFTNMDSKWLKCYERSTLYGEVLEMIDYSPEVGSYLKIICFPTFAGHCGCILFDLENIELIQNSADAPKALGIYLKGAQVTRDNL